MEAEKGGKATCMLHFKSDAKLTSEEFVKVFKEFDKDGKIAFGIVFIYGSSQSKGEFLATRKLTYLLLVPFVYREWLYRGRRTH